jgi:hypothetical protein
MYTLWQDGIRALQRDASNPISAALLAHIASVKAALFDAQVTVREQQATIQRLERAVEQLSTIQQARIYLAERAREGDARLDGGWDRALYNTEHSEDVQP